MSGSPQGPDSCTQKFEMKESWNDKKSSGTDRSLPSAEAGPCRGGGGGCICQVVTETRWWRKKLFSLSLRPPEIVSIAYNSFQLFQISGDRNSFFRHHRIVGVSEVRDDRKPVLHYRDSNVGCADENVVRIRFTVS